jgi:hypothetical protein
MTFGLFLCFLAASSPLLSLSLAEEEAFEASAFFGFALKKLRMSYKKKFPESDAVFDAVSEIALERTTWTGLECQC